jgi:phenylalanyl-tRNA synthetase beta chain
VPSSSKDEINNIENSLVNKKFKTISKLKKTLVSNGVSEVITFSFHSNRAQEILTGDKSLKISNAISDDQSFMRNSMIFNHLESAELNFKKGIKNIQLFEIGPIYNSSQSQENILSLLISSQDDTNSIYKSVNFNFYSLTELASKLISSLNFDIKQFNISRSTSNIYHPGQSAEVHMGKKLIARYGKVHPLIMEEFPKLKNTYAIELFFENLPIETISRINSINISDSQFQFSEKDFSFIFEKQQNLYEVQRYVTGIDKNLIKNVEFFDLYESKDLGDSSKSVTFRVTIQSKEKTLEEKDLEQLHKNILEKVSNKFKAKIRT